MSRLFHLDNTAPVVPKKIRSEGCRLVTIAVIPDTCAKGACGYSLNGDYIRGKGDRGARFFKSR